TADPIMQAPFRLTQGQNRYAYAFNDPINKTDQSGFEWTDFGNTAYAGGVAAWVGTAAYLTGADFAASLPGIGLAAGNIATTFLEGIGAGSKGGTYKLPAPTGAASSNPNHPGGLSGVGSASGGGSPLAAPVQERPSSLDERPFKGLPDSAA